jgi:hypothetical protein
VGSYHVNALLRLSWHRMLLGAAPAAARLAGAARVAPIPLGLPSPSCTKAMRHQTRVSLKTRSVLTDVQTSCW